MHQALFLLMKLILSEAKEAVIVNMNPVAEWSLSYWFKWTVGVITLKGMLLFYKWTLLTRGTIIAKYVGA